MLHLVLLPGFGEPQGDRDQRTWALAGLRRRAPARVRAQQRVAMARALCMAQ